MSRWQVAKLVAGEDLRIEWRSRVLTSPLLPFAGATMVMLAFDATNVRHRAGSLANRIVDVVGGRVA